MNLRGLVGATLAILALAGCEPQTVDGLLVGETPANYEPEAPSVAPGPRVISAESQALKTYYAGVMQDQLTRGLLRLDGGGPDTPYSADTLVKNFERIAFFNEYTRGRVNLRRWADPVRIEARFGPSVSAETRAKDTAELSKYSSRLARLTQHPISFGSSANANFHVFFVSEDDRPLAVQQIKALEPGIDNATLRLIEEMPRRIFCLVVAFNPVGRSGTYTRAVAVIRAEQPDLMRKSCIHEEVAQGLGLANDYILARPSIFNDDDEFALLTSHDEKLLQILYDPRLRGNMQAQEALPIVRRIAENLTNPSS